MRIVYFGTGAFSIPALRAMAKHVCLVVTQPDRPSGRGMKIQPSPAKLAALELGLPVETPERARAPEFVLNIESMQADALLVASYGQILSERLLNAAKRGGINLHGSVLPRWRGAAPIQRAILSGDAETGVTLMQMDKGMDTGGIIAIERTPIGPDETYGELQDRLAVVAAQMAVDWMPRIVAGDYEPTPQDDRRATVAAKIDRSDSEITIDYPAFAAYAKFKAFHPAPGAYVNTKLGKLKILGARMGTNPGMPGVVISIGTGLEVAFGGGSLLLNEVQLEGKKRMSGRDFANGMRIKPGDRID
jgi:methionyl-tRNA formyltransferase